MPPKNTASRFHNKQHHPTVTSPYPASPHLIARPKRPLAPRPTIRPLHRRLHSRGNHLGDARRDRHGADARLRLGQRGGLGRRRWVRDAEAVAELLDQGEGEVAEGLAGFEGGFGEGAAAAPEDR
ncbi:hypothetical protein V493_07906, partial [Pseudogymnoascus sp. VKM F-4281 (FW-2241)]